MLTSAFALQCTLSLITYCCNRRKPKNKKSRVEELPIIDEAMSDNSDIKNTGKFHLLPPVINSINNDDNNVEGELEDRQSTENNIV